MEFVSVFVENENNDKPLEIVENFPTLLTWRACGIISHLPRRTAPFFQKYFDAHGARGCVSDQ